MGRNNIIMSQFYCTQCGNEGTPVWRRKGAEREAGHLKKLFCLTCQKEQNHVECKPFTKYTYEDFITEFEYGNFTPEGQRKQTYGELRGLIHNGQIKKVKTLVNVRDSRFGKEYMVKES